MFIERRSLCQKLVFGLVSASLGYLLAFLTIQYDSDSIDLGYILHEPLVDDELSRQTRSLLSTERSPDDCQCQTSHFGTTGLKVNYFGNAFGEHDAYQKAKARRAERLRQWKKREVLKSPIRTGTILYTAPIPIIFPYYGLKTIPMGEMSIPALRLLPLSDAKSDSKLKRASYPVSCIHSSLHCVALYAHYGDINFPEILNSDVQIAYDNRDHKRSVTIYSRSLKNVNALLETLHYQNTVYESRGATDVLTVRYGTHKAQIPINIEHIKQPVLVDPGRGELSDLVTICIKTFERYPCLRRLIESIRSQHPKIRIVIADDSINFEPIAYENVQQFKMPPAAGFNNGKNLAISQVTTEYLVWVDDDFYFSNQTDLRWMLSVMENTDLEVIGGKAGTSRWGYTSTLHRIKGGEDGDCLYRKYGHWGALAGYPTCVLADVIQNFYMARTLSLRAVAFDGLFKRVSHKEFFLDGLGRLKIAQCSNIEIHHDHSCISNQHKIDFYLKYRDPGTAERDFIDQTWFIRSNLQCIAEHKTYGANKFFNLTTATADHP